MSKVNIKTSKNELKDAKESEKEITALSDDELENVSGGVVNGGYCIWCRSFNDPCDCYKKK